MSILSAVIQPNGWVLAITYPAGTTPGAWNFAGYDQTNGQFLSGGVDQYPLDAKGTPKGVLSFNSPGHVRSGGVAAAATRARTVLVSKVLRRPFPNSTQLSQVNNGDGTVTDRFALTDCICANDTGLVLNLAAGWRVGQPAASSIAVTNNSVRTPPLPISRWATPPFLPVEGTVGTPNTSVQVDVIIASHFPENPGDGTLHQACAALELMATDGTTAKTFWFTAPQTSPAYGDNLRCWGGAIDLSGLNPGMVTIHRRVWPWIGAPRATGAMDATGHVASKTAASAGAHDSPLTIFYDPTGTRYGGRKRFVFVDATSPNTTTASAASVVFHTTLDAARAAAESTKPASLNVACEALRIFYAANPSLDLPPANGFTPFAARAADFCEITLTDGQVHTLGPSMGTTTVDAREGLVILQGDPAAENPRANTILRSGSAAVANRVTRWWWRNFRLEMGQATLFSGGGEFLFLDQLTLRGKAGFETGTNQLWASGVTNGQRVVQCDMASYGAQPSGGMMRNVTRTSSAGGTALIGVTINTEAGTNRNAVAFIPSTGVLDQMLWNCRAYGWTSAMTDPGAIGGTAGGSGVFGSPLIARRFAAVNVLIEGAAGNAAMQLGENGSFIQLQDSILDGLAVYGSRMNWHNEPNMPFSASGTTVTAGIVGHGMVAGDSFTVAGLTPAAYNGTFTVLNVIDANRFRYTALSAPGAMTNPYVGATVTRASDGAVFPVVRLQSAHIGNAVMNCCFDRNATKQDNWVPDGQLTDSWELLYGVGQRSNFRANRGVNGANQFQYAFDGLKSETETTFEAERSWWGITNYRAGVGEYNGDYRPAAGSRIIGAGSVSNIDRDMNGAVRGSSFAAGPLEADGASGLLALGPMSGRHAHGATAARLAFAGRLGPASAVQAQTATATRIAAGEHLRAAGAVHGLRDSAARVRDAAALPRADPRRTFVVCAEQRTLRPTGE